MPLDGEPLSATLIEPKNGSYVRGVVTIRAEVSDNEAIDRVEYDHVARWALRP